MKDQCPTPEAKRILEALHEAKAEIERLRELLEHAAICDFPDSVRFRCPTCVKVDAALREKEEK